MTTVTKTPKAVNYSPETTVALLAGYAKGDAVEALAAQFGKTTRSIVSKLSKEGVYKKQDAKAKTTGEAVVKAAKADLVTQIAGVLGVPEEKLEGLEKANKSTIQLLLKSLTVDESDFATEQDLAKWEHVVQDEFGDEAVA
jgi:hypothetical protein